MEQLPPELWKIVLDLSDRSTRKALRATCKYGAAVATPCVFSTLHTGYFNIRLRRLIKLSENPHLARHVKSLVFSGCVLREFTSEYEWNIALGSCIRLIDKLHPNSKPLFEDRVFSYQRYTGLLQQQLEWDESDDKTFATALSRFPNLCRVTSGFARPQLRNLRHELGFYYYLCSLRATRRRASLVTPQFGRRSEYLLNGLMERAQQPSACPITHLYLSNCNRQPSFGEPNSSMQVLERVTFLLLSVRYYFSVSNPAHNRPVSGVQAILDAATNLCELRLYLKDEGFPGFRSTEVDHDFLACLVIPTFPSLRKLSIRCTTSETSLEGLLKKVASSLRYLQLERCVLLSGTWQRLLGTFPSMLKLEDVSLEDLRGIRIRLQPQQIFTRYERYFPNGLNSSTSANSYDQAIREYILHGKGEMPQLVAVDENS